MENKPAILDDQVAAIPPSLRKLFPVFVLLLMIGRLLPLPPTSFNKKGEQPPHRTKGELLSEYAGLLACLVMVSAFQARYKDCALGHQYCLGLST